MFSRPHGLEDIQTSEGTVDGRTRSGLVSVLFSFLFSLLSGTRPSQGHMSRVAAKVLWAWASLSWFWWNFHRFLSSSTRERIFVENGGNHHSFITFFLSFFFFVKAGRQLDPVFQQTGEKKAVLSWDLGSFSEARPVLDRSLEMNKDQWHTSLNFVFLVCFFFFTLSDRTDIQNSKNVRRSYIVLLGHFSVSFKVCTH